MNSFYEANITIKLDKDITHTHTHRYTHTVNRTPRRKSDSSAETLQPEGMSWYSKWKRGGGRGGMPSKAIIQIWKKDYIL